MRHPEYVLTYGLLATFAAYSVFMQCWREMFRFFRIRHNQLVAPAHAGKSLGKAA